MHVLQAAILVVVALLLTNQIIRSSYLLRFSVFNLCTNL
jgi:hypothetical protein